LAFWPPPRTSTAWFSRGRYPGRANDFGSAAEELAALLREQGYSEQRWLPIGVGFVHGFAVTTRLERFEGESPNGATPRWSARYGEAARLVWLQGARAVSVVAPGRYRVFLVAVTDLPLDAAGAAPVWDQTTVMVGPGIPDDLDELDLPRSRRLSSRHRLGVYAYVFESGEGEAVGHAVSLDPERPSGAAQLRPFERFAEHLVPPSAELAPGLAPLNEGDIP